VELGESDALIGEVIEVRRVDLATIATDVRPSHVVDEDEEDVWAFGDCFLGLCPGGRCDSCGGKAEAGLFHEFASVWHMGSYWCLERVTSRYGFW